MRNRWRSALLPETNTNPQKSWSPWVTTLAAFLLLNLALGMHNVWPTLWVTTRFEFSLEAAAIVLVIAGMLALKGRLTSGQTWAIALGLVLLVAGRYADVTSHALYGRSINLYWDAQHLPGIVAMMAQAATTWQLAGAIAALAVVGLVLVFAARWLVLCLAGGMTVPRIRATLAAVSVALFGVHAAGTLTANPALTAWFAVPVSQSAAAQVGLLARALSARASEDFQRDPLVDPLLAQVSDADVIILFIESYGATTLDSPAYRDPLEPARRQLADSVADTGHRMVSARVTSPTFGGGSWLAHSSLLTGLKVPDDRTYRLLLASDRDSLVHRFAASGHRTLGLMPGIRLAWPEGGYYGYETLYDAQTLDYRGPPFGWWRIPDQYALARVNTLELAPEDRRPVFMVFTTINSHAPFMPVPPYLEDWHSVQHADGFGEVAVDAVEPASAWSNPGAAYADSIHYALQTVAGFLEQPRQRDLVLVVIGDHQPAAAVTGPDASHDVPVHVITKRTAVLHELTAGGFVEGVMPEAETIGPMHGLTDLLLGAFAGSGSDPAMTH